MTPAGRLQAAIEILEGLHESRMPADRFIREYFRARRYAGSKDRAAVSERVYDIFRHRAAYAWRMGHDTPRALAIASVLAEGGDPDTVFAGGNYAPSPLTDAERAAIAAAPLRDAPLHVQGEYPEFLENELKRAFGNRLLEELRAMQQRAPIDLRVNTLKAGRGDVVERLRAGGFEAAATPWSPMGIRIASARGLEQTKLFAGGLFEFQDEAAQIACILCGARPGMRVLDLAAGAGGKSLALAALMDNQGQIVASDIEDARLRQIAPRAERAGATIIRPVLGHHRAAAVGGSTASDAPLIRRSPPETGEGNVLFDLVLVDAPCSGSGTWRRQPENKWRLTPQRLERLQAMQDTLLDDAAAFVRPGGGLVYATCSVFPCENGDRIQSFLRRHPDFQVRPAREAWAESQTAPAPAGMADFFIATPLLTGTDGFFTAVLSRAG